MSTNIVISLVLSLVLTLLLETGFFLLVRLINGKRHKKDALLVLIVNVLTNPVVVLLYWLAILYTNINHVILMAPLEIFAVLTEGYIYKKHGRFFEHPYAFSIAANAFSFGTGLLLQLLQII